MIGKLCCMNKPNTPPPSKPLAGRWIDVFRAGTHTDSQGNVTTFTTADLDQIVANHALGAAPAVIGHPKDNAPAYAWVEEVKRDGDLLFTKFKDVNPDFDAGVESGAYRNRSVSLVKDPAHGLRLRHVGWLGAMAPAIPGLSHDFSDAGEVMEFATHAVTRAAWALQTSGHLFRGLREMLIADKGQEEADRIIPNYQIDIIESSSTELLSDPDSTSNFSTGENHMPITQQQLEAAQAEARREGQEAATQEFNAQLTAERGRADALEAERRNERIQAQIAEWKKQGKVVPAEEAGLVEFMSNLEAGAQTFEFSAVDGNTKVTKTPGQWFAEFMAASPAKVKLNDKSENEAGDTGDQSADELAVKIKNYMADQEKKGISITYAEALAQVK